MDNLSWGVDGYGRAHICNSKNEVLFCMFDGGGQAGIYILRGEL